VRRGACHGQGHAKTTLNWPTVTVRAETLAGHMDPLALAPKDPTCKPVQRQLNTTSLLATQINQGLESSTKHALFRVLLHITSTATTMNANAGMATQVITRLICSGSHKVLYPSESRGRSLLPQRPELDPLTLTHKVLALPHLVSTGTTLIQLCWHMVVNHVSSLIRLHPLHQSGSLSLLTLFVLVLTPSGTVYLSENVIRPNQCGCV
jgi:hypothetical protein